MKKTPLNQVIKKIGLEGTHETWNDKVVKKVRKQIFNQIAFDLEVWFKAHDELNQSFQSDDLIKYLKKHL